MLRETPLVMMPLAVGRCPLSRRAEWRSVRDSRSMAAPDSPDLPVLWRTKLRSTLAGIDHAEQVAHCVDSGLIGIGWRIDEMTSGTSLDVVCQTIEDNPNEGWGRSAAQTVGRRTSAR